MNSFIKLWVLSGIFICQCNILSAQKDKEAFNASFVLQYADSAYKIASTGVFYIGDKLKGKLVFDGKNPDKKKYCYVLIYNDNSPVFYLAYPFEDSGNIANQFPKINDAGQVIKEITLFEGEVTYPLGVDNIVAILSENPIVNYASIFNNDTSNNHVRAAQNPGKTELIKFLKGSKLSAFYNPAYGEVEIKTIQLETREKQEKKGVLYGTITSTRNNPKESKFIIEDADGIAEIFYTPTPQEDVIRDNFPIIDIIDPTFDTTAIRGLRVLKSADSKKILIRGIVADRQRGIKKLTLNDQIPTTYRESTGFFDYLYEPKKGPNVIDITAENKEGYKRTLRFRFQYNGKTEEITAKGKDYLLVMGIDKYKNWPVLSNPAADAKAFKEVMVDNYGYKNENVIELFNENATRKNIYTQLKKLVDNLTENDRLLVYYAGHGFYDEKLELGYWIPVNAESEEYDEFLNNLDIARYIQKMKAKNIFVIADACYSGSLVRDMQKENSKDYRSRIILCAGKLQPVSDGKPGNHSPFATQVLQFFKTSTNKTVLASDLIQFVKLTLKKAPPVGGALDEVGDENGDFIFERKE